MKSTQFEEFATVDEDELSRTEVIVVAWLLPDVGYKAELAKITMTFACRQKVT